MSYSESNMHAKFSYWMLVMFDSKFFFFVLSRVDFDQEHPLNIPETCFFFFFLNQSGSSM